MILKQGMKFKAKTKALQEYKYLYLGKIKEQIEALKQTARFYKKRIMKREKERRKQKL